MSTTPSWQARCVKVAIRMRMRHRDWGDDRALARRARRVFGAPRPLQWLGTRGVRIHPIADGRVRGEWVTVDEPDPGTIVYFHGGGYVAGAAARWRPITAGLARRARRRVLALDYRLAPEHRFPAALDDAVHAYRWLLEHGDAPRAVALAGDSAGGGLVLATLLRLRDEGVPLPACAVCFSPFTDLAATDESLRQNEGRCPTFYARNMGEFARVYLGAASRRDPYASPVFGDFAGLPPMLLQVASNELLLDDARRVHEKVRNAGGHSELTVFDELFHVWQMLDGVVPEAGAALDQAAAFLSRAIARG
ncbi:MAG: alpha/beta hydrolase [Candidatus Rokubacteria bacterium]|nr:alpha/beta hydrolase [Candidatus Rokubacteria bacterium]